MRPPTQSMKFSPWERSGSEKLAELSLSVVRDDLAPAQHGVEGTGFGMLTMNTTVPSRKPSFGVRRPVATNGGHSHHRAGRPDRHDARGAYHDSCYRRRNAHCGQLGVQAIPQSPRRTAGRKPLQPGYSPNRQAPSQPAQRARAIQPWSSRPRHRRLGMNSSS